MSDNEIRITSATGARKGTKTDRYDLIPAGALRELAHHYGVGAEKYTERDASGNIIHDGAENWRLGYNWSLSYAALQRHANQFWAGEDYDTETGAKHIIAVAWHALALATFMDTHRALDDRHVPPAQPVSVIGILAARLVKSRTKSQAPLRFSFPTKAKSN